MKLTDNSILITGGGSGIGLGFVQAFSALGNRILICGRDTQKLDQAQKRFPAIQTMTCDISQAGQRDHLIEHINRNFSQLNMVINNAAVYLAYRFDDGEDHTAMIDQELSTNLTAHIHLTDRLLPCLLQQSESAIVNITSALARVLHPMACVYSATKSGLSMFSQALRIQLRNTPVKIFEVSPPLVDTAMCSGGKGKTSVEQLIQETLKGLKENKYNIYVGKTKLFYLLHNLNPLIANKLIGRI